MSKNNEALALSPANQRKLENSPNYCSTNNPKYILTSLQQNAQKISKKFTDALNQNRSYIRINDNPNKKVPISIYAGVVVTSSRVSRRRYHN